MLMFNPARHSPSTLPFSPFPPCASSLQYYDPDIFPYMKDQKNFEQNVFNKTHKADSESPPVFPPSPVFPHWDANGSGESRADLRPRRVLRLSIPTQEELSFSSPFFPPS